ncbi:hypothetical protein EVAR_39537_1 [Eumeta japonica]|uniref:CCHC-type domain-containing protein n=1 Tax=Eumeta variegata TaxID=151549 RepID=A0A4C1XNR8_EUMVA|nr:hypothetical protein EVAR_39537_1 [Eumeta japonica]
MSDKEQEKAIFTSRQSICRTPPNMVSVVEEMQTTLTTGKRPRESPGEAQPPTRLRRDTERSETQAEVDVERSLCSASKELIERRCIAWPGYPGGGCGAKSASGGGQATASAKLEATRAVAVCGEQGPAQPAARSHASALKLPGPARASAEAKRPAGGPVLAFYPVAEQAELIKTAEETKKLLKSAMDPTSMQVEVTKARKVGRAGVVVQTTSAEAAEKIRKAVPPTLRVTEPQSVRGSVRRGGRLRAFLRIKHPDWTIERLTKSCRVAFKKSRRERATTTVVLECEPELHDVLVSLDRAYIGWEAARSSETVCSKCELTGHRAADCKAEVTRCGTCHRFGRREADTHLTAARECPARRFAKERLITVTRYG